VVQTNHLTPISTLDPQLSYVKEIFPSVVSLVAPTQFPLVACGGGLPLGASVECEMASSRSPSRLHADGARAKRHLPASLCATLTILDAFEANLTHSSQLWWTDKYVMQVRGEFAGSLEAEPCLCKLLSGRVRRSTENTKFKAKSWIQVSVWTMWTNLRCN